MNITYYSTPLPLLNLVKNGARLLPTCSLNDSIAQNLELIIMTKPGEHRFDPDFGCKIWNLDFNLLSSQRDWENNMKNFLVESVENYETRLTNISITIKITNLNKPNLFKQHPEIKKCVNIDIKAFIRGTKSERFSYNTDLFLSPLSKN